MTIVTAPPQTPPTAPVREHQRLTSGHLPRWAPWGILGASALITALVIGVLAMAGGSDFNLAGWGVVTALVYLILIMVISSLVEGRRKGVDRLVTGVVTVAFAIAMVP